jgi:hypothetical protein
MKMLLLALLAALALAACGGSDQPAAPPPPANLSIDEVLASPPEGPVTVRGAIVAPEGEPVRLCSALAESYPPQCGGSSLVVEGLDLATLKGLTSTNDPSLAQVTWSEGEVSLLGEVENGILTVS